MAGNDITTRNLILKGLINTHEKPKEHILRLFCALTSPAEMPRPKNSSRKMQEEFSSSRGTQQKIEQVFTEPAEPVQEIISSYACSFLNASCVCEWPFYVSFFFYRLASYLIFNVSTRFN